MKSWKISIKFSDSSKALEKEIILFDAQTFFNGYLKIRRTYFNALIKAIKISRNYNSEKGIDKIIGPDNRDWTNNAWLLLLIKDTEKMKPFWILIKREKDLSGLLIALGPKSFVEHSNNNQEVKREIKNLLNYFISYINKFECTILIPNFLI